MARIRKPTFDKPSPETYVKAALGTVGLQSRTNGCLPHAIMVSWTWKGKDISCMQSVYVLHAFWDQGAKKEWWIALLSKLVPDFSDLLVLFFMVIDSMAGIVLMDLGAGITDWVFSLRFLGLVHVSFPYLNCCKLHNEPQQESAGSFLEESESKLSCWNGIRCCDTFCLNTRVLHQKI